MHEIRYIKWVLSEAKIAARQNNLEFHKFADQCITITNSFAMGPLSFSIISNSANSAITPPPFSYPPTRFSQGWSRNAKYHVSMNSRDHSSFKLSNGGNGVHARAYQNVKPTSTLFCEDTSKEAQENIDDDIASIRRLFSDITKSHTSVSAYDTAWVAMVPSLKNSKIPQFPQCLSWMIENQHWDGSWGLLDLPYIKDRLSHTLSCLIALRTWNLGTENVEMGLRFTKENIGKIVSEDTYNPPGFDLIFTAMLEDAKALCLELPYESPPIKMMLTKREKLLKGIEISHMSEYDTSLILMVEGIRKIVDWNKVLSHQNKDGSLFRSPSATACALMHTKNSSCLHYLNSMLENLDNKVPNVYPLNSIAGLSMVNSLESLGLARHFKSEIKEALDEVYRCWIENKVIEGISSASDLFNMSISFKILRWNGYDVSPDVFISYLKQSDLLSLESSDQAARAMLNLYRASQLMFSGETILQESRSFSQTYLKNIMMGDQNIVLKDLYKEIKYALDVPWRASLDRIEHLSYMKTIHFDDIWIGKTSYRIPFIDKDCFLSLAKKDYNICQAAQQEDLQELEKWNADSKLGDLHFARQRLLACYFGIASTIFAPDMSTVRIVLAKNAILITVMDDFYDIKGSIETIECFVEAIRSWDPKAICSCPDDVKILFSAIYNTVNDIAQDAWAIQRRAISTQLREIWYRLAVAMRKEAEWTKSGNIPSLQEYIENGTIYIALEPIVVTSLYFVGPELSEQIIHHHEGRSLIQLISICGRLLNDIQSDKREIKEGKINAVSLFMKEHPGTSSEDATEWLRTTVDDSTQKLLRNLLQPSALPRDCKLIFWNMLKNVQLAYLNTDEFTTPTTVAGYMKAVLFDPVL